MAYATIDDVKARTTRDYTETDETVMAALLDDAAVMIDATGTTAGDDEKKVVSCRMVIRAMGDSGGGYGVPVGASQGSMTAGPYTQSWTMGTGSSGELYLGKADKALLGLGNRIGARSPLELYARVPEGDPSRTEWMVPDD